MCGRYALTLPVEAMGRLFGVAERPNLAPRYNVAPTQRVAVVRAGGELGRELAQLRWGLVPSWAKDLAGAPLINARAETAAEKPSFRQAFARRRCLVPADGFYEWRRDGRAKQAYFIRAARPDTILAFAGLWERWQPPGGGEVLESVAILTVPGNEVMAPIHDRMPAILGPDAWNPWLAGEGGTAALAAMLAPARDDAVVAQAVGDHVNRVANDDPGCWDPPGAGRLL